MLERKDHDTLFQFNQEFDQYPLRYGSVLLYQVGEVHYQGGFEDTHEQWCSEISVILSGRGVFLLDDQAYPVEQHDIILTPPRGVHTIRALEQPLRYAYMGFSFAPEVLPALTPIKQFVEQVPHHCKCVDLYDLSSLFDRLLTEFYRALPHSAAVIQNYLETLLFLTHRSFCGVPPEHAPTSAKKNVVGVTVYHVIKYIDANLASLSDIRTLAATLNFNHSYLSHIFKQKTGITLQRYVIEKKIERSCVLIREGRLRMTDIALLLNYESLSSFSKSFKQVTGMSPTAYQRHHGSNST